MANAIELAEETLAVARANLDTVTAEQVAKETAAKNAFEADPSSENASALVHARAIASVTILLAEKKRDDAVAALADLQRAEKLEEMGKLESVFNTKAHHDYLASLVPEIVKHRRALAEIAGKILADANERSAAVHAWDSIARNLRLEDDRMMMINSVRGAARGALDTAARLAHDEASKGLVRLHVEGSTRGRASMTEDAIVLSWAFGGSI